MVQTPLTPDLTQPGNGNSLVVIVGIPAYNEEKTIAKVILNAQQHAHVVVVCDDGSNDLTAEIAERMGAVVIRHPKNLGYGAALQSLFRRAKDLAADVLVTLDSDGQHDPTEIPNITKPIEAGEADVVLGSRFLNQKGTKDMPGYRQVGVKVITALTNGNRQNGLTDAQCGFRAYNKTALNCLTLNENGMSASVEILRSANKSNLKIIEIPVTCKYASSTGTKTSTKNPLSHGVGLVMSLVKLVVEDRPLPSLGIPGIICLSIGLFFSLWMLEVYTKAGYIITNLAIGSVGFLLIGFFLLSTAITLYAISRIRNKVKLL
ncbi:MAG: glycosyltransferase family 2 protein [Candidatus Bathyarchaeota archaeon]|nr:glycosyltransferase family 2 protein [Candidatus Bathyarchaeota archaeon]